MCRHPCTLGAYSLCCAFMLQVMHFLNELYEVFDELVDQYDMYKLDIVGDCYIVVAGLIKEDQVGSGVEAGRAQGTPDVDLRRGVGSIRVMLPRPGIEQASSAARDV